MRMIMIGNWTRIISCDLSVISMAVPVVIDCCRMMIMRGDSKFPCSLHRRQIDARRPGHPAESEGYREQTYTNSANGIAHEEILAFRRAIA